MADDGSLKRVWTCSDGIEAGLAHYPAAGTHDRHAHPHLQVSFVLAGAMAETLERRDHVPLAGWRGVKPAGAVHSDRWGPAGVLLFTLRIREGHEATAALNDEQGWRPLARPAAVAAVVRGFAAGGSPALLHEAALDLLALDGGEAHAPADAPPWLARARALLHEAPEEISVAAAAAGAGVHRAQLARMFVRHFGCAPSLYRRRLLVARATEAALRSEAPLAEVATGTGFCDQAHLTRAMRAETGLTPGSARALLAATSVQARPARIG